MPGHHPDGTRSETYPPLNTLKPVCDDIWIVDGPVIRFGMPWPKMSFPTRMTVVRLSGGRLLLHSPTLLTPELQSEIEQLGQPSWNVGPNRIHYWHIPEWRVAFPRAAAYLAPRIVEQARGRLEFPHHRLAMEGGYPWDEDLATLPVAGSFMTEMEFFHRRSRTLILTDLIENFEADHLKSGWMRLLTWLGAVRDPDGQMPRDMRVTFRKHRRELRVAIEKMIAWNPERIILAHGRWYERDGAAELRRAFRWILE